MTVKLFERNNSIYAQKNTSKLIVFNKKGRGNLALSKDRAVRRTDFSTKLIVFNKKGRGNLALSKDRAVRRTDFSTEKSGFKRVTDGDY